MIYPVRTSDEVEALREIRNSCRSFMTRDRTFIDPASQRAWWRSRPENMQVFLYRPTGCAVPAGYGLIREEGPDRSWLTGGLRPEFRGRGLGLPLFVRLVATAEGWPWLEVRADNHAARRLYQKMGFEEASRRDGVITMRLP